MGCSSSQLLKKPTNPLEEIQMQESQREHSRKQQKKQQKQIERLKKKQKKRFREGKRKLSDSESNSKDFNAMSTVVKQRSSNESTLLEFTMRYDFRREEFHRQLEGTIQKQLNEDLCGFILNQATFAVQFFKNYESELSSISDVLLTMEEELNQNLDEHSILLTNPLDVAVARWINFKPIHGPVKHQYQLLQSQTMLMVFENIDIARPNDANYDSISPLCKVHMEMDFRETTPCKEDYLEMLNDIRWKGYVRLRLHEDPKKQEEQKKELKPPTTTDLEDIYSETSSGYSTASPYGSKAALDAIKAPSATYYFGDEDYDYAFITHLNTLHPLSELKMSKQDSAENIDVKVLPDCCISTLGEFVQPLLEEEFTDDEDESESEPENYDDDDENQEEGNYSCRKKPEDYRDYDTLQAIKLYRIELEKRRKQLSRNYLNSREFMRYFGELVDKSLAEKLQIDYMDMDEASFRGYSIYTPQYELIPAIYVAQNACDWPKCAFEFRLRNRPMSINPQTGQQTQWPTRAMIKRIETFGFHLVPVGYAPKRRRNPFRDIEWRIVFPKAERYLEQNLTNGQIKVFMLTKALLKSFVEPVEKDKSLMFVLDHLRMHLFWECEKDYHAWPEELLGDVLIRFLESLKQRVKQKNLPDFFIRERNLFESIPEYSLSTLHIILADILANPLMHLMVALRNLDFSENYFPKLNVKQVFENLRENEIVQLKLLAKNGRSLLHLVLDDEDGETNGIMPEAGASGLVGLKQHGVRTRGKLRRKTHLLRHTIELKKQEMVARRKSEESIDVEFFFDQNLNSSQLRNINQGVENLRRTNILEIFIDQLIAMAAKAIEYHSIMMAKGLIAHARRLCKFYHNYGCDVGAKEYLSIIHNLDEELQVLYDSEDFMEETAAPSLPRRGSMEPSCHASATMRSCIENDGLKIQRRHGEMHKKLNEPLKSIKLKEENQNYDDINAIEVCNSDDFSKSPRVKLKKEYRNYDDINAIQECSSDDFPKSSKTLEPRKSIHFRNVVVVVHQGDTNPIQKPEGYSPVGILRMNSQPIEEEILSDSEEENIRPELPEKQTTKKTSNSTLSTRKTSPSSANRIEKPEGYSPVGILRMNSQSVGKEILSDSDEGINHELQEKQTTKTPSKSTLPNKKTSNSAVKILRMNSQPMEEEILSDSEEDIKPELSENQTTKKTLNSTLSTKKKSPSAVGILKLKSQPIEEESSSDCEEVIEAELPEKQTSKKYSKSTLPNKKTSPSPMEILKLNSQPIEEEILSDSEEEDIKSELPEDQTSCNSTLPNKKASTSRFKLPGFLQSSADFLKTSPLATTDLFQNVSQSTHKLVNQVASEDKRKEFRDIIKQKTLKLKGVFSQSSES